MTSEPLWSPLPIIGFFLSFAGIVYVLLSRNVRAKRIVLPITIFVFSGFWFEMFRRSTLQPNNVLILVAIGVFLNAIWVIRVSRALHYCSRCGRTFQRGLRGRKDLCPTCLTADVSSQRSN